MIDPDRLQPSKETREQNLERARRMRRYPTTAEGFLWKLLRTKLLEGSKFRRQHRLGPFILDFYCPAARLVVELDGSVHGEERQQAWDARRTHELEVRGIRVLR